MMREKRSLLNMQNNYTQHMGEHVEYESGKDKYPYYPIYSIEEIRAVDGYEVTYSVEKNDKMYIRLMKPAIL